MKTFFSLCFINLIIFCYSLPAYLTDERTKKSYEKAKNLYRVLRYMDEEERVTSHGEAPSSDNKTEPITAPDINPSGSETQKPPENTQVLTFGNFEAEKENENAQTSIFIIKYTVLMYFADGSIPQEIEITITVNIQTSRVRNLQETTESVKTTCNLKKSNEGIAAYDCNGKTETQGSDVEEVKVNIKEPILANGKKLDVGFSGTAAEIGNNLHNSTIEIDSSATPYTLKEGKIESKTKTSFKVKGIINIFNYKQGDKFNFTFPNKIDEKNKENIYVECIVDSKDDDDNVVFKCPVNKPLNAIVDQAVGTYTGKPADSVTFNFKEGERRDVVLEDPSSEGNGGNNGYYRKNSSGLSGGAIAGIVIASAVALIVASVVAMMFRKSKPIENVSSTNVGLNAPEHF